MEVLAAKTDPQVAEEVSGAIKELEV